MLWTEEKLFKEKVSYDPTYSLIQLLTNIPSEKLDKMALHEHLIRISA
jgi:hypothetical protein